MRKIVGLVLGLGAVVAELSVVQAATEVAHFPANNRFASATSNAPDGSSTSVFVSREIGQPGGPVDTVSVITSQPDGSFTLAVGVLPQGAFQFSAQSASLDVDLNAITLTTLIGELPENGVVSVDWDGTETTRTAGNSVLEFDNVRVIFSGVRTAVVADVTGTVFGVPLVSPVGDLLALSQQVTVITRD
jgi:hypothetical protein